MTSDTTTQAAWYYERSGQRIGPIPLNEIRTLVASAGLSGSTLVWRSGWAAWKPVHETELGSDLPSAKKSVATPRPLIEPEIPNGVKGWSWGAFLLSLFWAIRFRVWWGLLSLVPVLGLGVLIWLGIKGRELAWQRGQWESVEAFARVQRRWSIAGTLFTVLSGVLLASIYVHEHPALLEGLHTVQAQPRQEEPVGAVAQVTSVAAVGADLHKLQGASTGDLLKDGYWGPKIAAINPIAGRQCVEQTLPQLPPLQFDGGRLAVSSAHGSHAENWVTGLVQLDADGQLDIAVVCDEASEQILLLTSRGISSGVSSAVARWLKEQGRGETAVTVFDGQRTRQATVAELLGAGSQAGGVSPAVVTIMGDSFQTHGSLLRVVDDNGGKQLLLGQKVVAGIEGDLIHLASAYRSQDRDTVLVTTACSGSSCSYTSFALLDIQPDGQVKVLSNKELVIAADSAVPAIAPQADGSLLISFPGFKGPQRWRYADGALAKL